MLCSKKRPLWLTWENMSQNSVDTDMEKMSFIFKHGDGRQLNLKKQYSQ